jgi:hypothetical protein
MLVAFLALLAFLGGFGGKSAKNVECAKGGRKNQNNTHSNTIIAKSEHKTQVLEQSSLFLVQK